MQCFKCEPEIPGQSRPSKLMAKVRDIRKYATTDYAKAHADEKVGRHTAGARDRTVAARAFMAHDYNRECTAVIQPGKWMHAPVLKTQKPDPTYVGCQA